ncbi:hypothetical protein [Croceicoccus gelatinilyticus]|nr:hypothetical protein [Croceicoccus gelatinilyticus]MBS7671424.1 hypothetical protein [Croceicoccus gelatinilyticus]
MRAIPFEKFNSPEYSADADELARLANDVLDELQTFLLIVDRLFFP